MSVCAPAFKLPTRLTTLQKACRQPVFTANPPIVPASSVVGTAKAVTPALSAAMVGRPGIFRIERQGIVTRYRHRPARGRGQTEPARQDVRQPQGCNERDVQKRAGHPLRSVELSFPEGKYSALGTDKNLRKQKLTTPTALVAQNGAVLHASVKVGVTGCPKHRTAARRFARSVRRRQGKEALRNVPTLT